MKALTILVAEDDLLARMVLERSVVQWGHQLVSAVDGKSALESLRTRKIEVCLLDWNMPGMTGIEICKQLRAGSVKTPIIVLSALGDELDKVLLLEIGADDYVVKPFGTRELMARIRAVLRRTRR
jgi:DNA-binding response OmpR family regulator